MVTGPAVRTEHLGRIYKLKPNRKQKQAARREGRTEPLPKREPTLEDVFVDLVGRSLDEDTGQQGDSQEP